MRYGRKLYNQKTKQYYLDSIRQIGDNNCESDIALLEIFYVKPMKACMVSP